MAKENHSENIEFKLLQNISRSYILSPLGSLTHKHYVVFGNDVLEMFENIPRATRIIHGLLYYFGYIVFVNRVGY